jgi:hypothetical protein
MTAKPEPRGESLADLLRDVLATEAQRQGMPPPTDEQYDEFLRLLAGLPTGPDEVPAKGEKGGQ